MSFTVPAAGGRSVLAKDARPLVGKMTMAGPGARTIVLSASKGEQISGAIEDERHGAFTYYLLKGLNGDAADKTGAVTGEGLFDYLKPKVVDAARLHNRDQSPQLAGPAGTLRLR